MTDERERSRYLTAREGVKPKAFWETMDAWPLYAGSQNLYRYLYLIDMLRSVTKIPGDVAEFGCWKGATTSLFAKMLRHSDKLVHAFDTFEGFDTQVQQEKQLRSGYKGSYDELVNMLRVDRLLAKVDFHVGDICATVPLLAEAAPEIRLSFALLDCDVYEPTQVALQWVDARINHGGIILFDQYGDPAWPGETQAADEFLKQHGSWYEIVKTPVPQPSLLLVRR